jgi:hypothetical protein
VTPEQGETATASFALTAQCGQCAADAVQNVCGAQAQACLQDPNCANASACVQNCAPGDALCIAACYQQASQVLDDLANCVVCQECPAECSGLWQCGGGGGGNVGGSGQGGNAQGGAAPAPGGQCDNTGVCEACLACAVQGPCSAQIQQCLQDPMCLMDPNQAKLAFECAVCTECKNDCAGVVPPLPPGLGLSCP